MNSHFFRSKLQPPTIQWYVDFGRLWEDTHLDLPFTYDDSHHQDDEPNIFRIVNSTPKPTHLPRVTGILGG